MAMKTARNGTWLERWNPEEAGWNSALAWRTLWITTFNLMLAFITWFVVSALVVRLPNVGFHLSTSQLFWLTAMPGLAAGTLRILHTFLIPIYGSRHVITFSTLSLLIALIGFGIDSFVETISGSVLIWRLSAETRADLDEEAVERVEERAERLVGVAFLVLAAYVGFEAVRTVVAQDPPDSSPIGVVLTALSIAVMLWLARAKRLTGEALGSRALIADAQQTYACWYLSIVTLAGLALNEFAGLWWADPLAALGIAALLVREGIEALRGDDD